MSLWSMMSVFMASQAHQPIELDVNSHGEGVEVRVLGRSEVAAVARYRLVVTSGSNGNRSTQSGQARLAPGRDATLVRLRMDGGDGKDWSVHLVVEPEGGVAYERSASSRTR